MKNRFLLIIQFCLFALTLMVMPACQHAQIKKGLISSGFLLIQPQRYTESLLCMASINIVVSNDSWKYQAIVEQKNNQYKVIVMSPIGQRLATLLYDGQSFESIRVMPLALPMSEREFAAAVQLVFAPTGLLPDSSVSVSWSAIESIEAGSLQRNVYNSGRQVIQINYQGVGQCGGRATMKSGFGYELHIISERI